MENNTDLTNKQIEKKAFTINALLTTILSFLVIGMMVFLIVKFAKRSFEVKNMELEEIAYRAEVDKAATEIVALCNLGPIPEKYFLTRNLPNINWSVAKIEKDDCPETNNFLITNILPISDHVDCIASIEKGETKIDGEYCGAYLF